MKDLFSELNGEQDEVKFKEGNHLTVVAKDEKNKLGSLNKTFNNLIKKIKRLKNGIVKDKEKFERILGHYMKNIPKLEKEIVDKKIALVKILHSASKRFKFSTRQLIDLEIIISDLCDEVFQSVEPEEDLIQIYDQWSDVSYEEEMKAQKGMLSDDLNQMFQEMAGVDVDFEEFIDLDDNPENQQEKLKKLFEKLNGLMKENESETTKRTRKKTKKQIEKEIRLKEEESRKLKDIRKVYLNLVKVLHPDKELNEKNKEWKEDLMKKVTNAYKENDLYKLLELELEFVTKNDDNLSDISENKMKSYISALKEQVNSLTNERNSIIYDYRFKNLEDINIYNERTAYRQIKDNEGDLRKELKYLVENEKNISTIKGQKRRILTFVDEQNDIIDNRLDLDSFADFLLKEMSDF